MDECAGDFADMWGGEAPWCCWNVMYVVFMVERNLHMLPTLNTHVYKNRKCEIWTFGEWLLSKKRKGMALKLCRELGIDDGVKNFLLVSYAAAVARKQL
jgi:hypothetical protein